MYLGGPFFPGVLLSFGPLRYSKFTQVGMDMERTCNMLRSVVTAENHPYARKISFFLWKVKLCCQFRPPKITEQVPYNQRSWVNFSFMGKLA